MNNPVTFATLSFNERDTPVSHQFDDIYFSTQDGLAESIYVFQEGNQIWEKWIEHQREFFVIAETGFGTGLNFFAVAETFQRFQQTYPNSPLKRLYFISFEKYPLTVAQYQKVHQSYPQFSTFSAKLCAHWQPRLQGCQRYHFDQSIYLDLWFGDIADNLPQLGDNYTAMVDAWFLDGFSPDKNPEMWNENLYQQMFRLSRNGGSFATFTAASSVRKGLQNAGFEVKKRKGFGKKREMLWGEKVNSNEHYTLKYPFFAQQAAKNSETFAIFGGGIASLFVALSLLERGKQVTLYCKDSELAQNASGNLQGAIYPQLSDDDEKNVRFYIHAFDYALQRITYLAKKVEFEHQFSGVALYAYNEKTAQKIKKLCSQWQTSLIKWEEKDSLSLQLGVTVDQGGAIISEAGWLAPKQMVQNTFAYLQTLGLKVVFNHQAENLQQIEDKWQWQANGSIFSADCVILATGHTIRNFSQTVEIPFYPVRGLVSQIPTNETLAKLKMVLCYDGYLTPASKQGTHCIGASHIRDNAQNEFNLEEHLANAAKLQKNVANCDWTELDLSQNLAKVGIRSALRDRVPMVGQVGNFAAQQKDYVNLYNQLRRKELKQAIKPAENFANLYLVGGLGSRGLTTAPLLGELLASLICKEPLPISEDIWHNLAPNRTWIRKMLKGK